MIQHVWDVNSSVAISSTIQVTSGRMIITETIILYHTPQLPISQLTISVKNKPSSLCYNIIKYWTIFTYSSTHHKYLLHADQRFIRKLLYMVMIINTKTIVYHTSEWAVSQWHISIRKAFTLPYLTCGMDGCVSRHPALRPQHGINAHCATPTDHKVSKTS